MENNVDEWDIDDWEKELNLASSPCNENNQIDFVRHYFACMNFPRNC